MLTHFIEFFLDICFCLRFCFCFAVVFVLFSFVLISGQSFSSNSKYTAVKTATVVLNIRTIIVLLLLTLKIVYYSRELSIQQIFIEQFAMQH